MATKQIIIGIDYREATANGAGKSRYTAELTKALQSAAPKNSEFRLYTYENIPGKALRWHLNLRRELKRNPVDLFISPTSYIPPVLAPKNQRVATVIHDIIAFLYPKGHHWFATMVERLTLKPAIRKSELLFTVSEATLKDLKESVAEARLKPAHIASPAVPAHFKPSKDKNMDLPDEFLLFVGTIHPRKNLKTLLQSFTQTLAQKHPKLHLVIAGAKGWKSEDLQSQIPSKLKSRIHFLGYVSDDELVELYSRAHALTFLSIYEGFGMPALEAMACDCPVIASNLSSIPEVTGDAALSIDPFDQAALNKAVAELYKEKTRQDCIKKGRKRVTAFSWNNSAKAILKWL